MTSGRPDAVLVAAARNGSEAAFTALVTRHQQGLRGFLRRLCRNHALADDIAQEAFLAAWTSLGSLKDASRFRSWLYGLGWRLAANRFRADDRRKAREEAYVAEQADLPGLSPEDRMALEAAMAELPPDQRAAVALCLSGGFSHTEAAEALGLPVGTVKSHVVRGRAKLLEALGETHDE